VTDPNVNTPVPDDDDDDGLFVAATDTFPRRNDMLNRLVVIYPTGEHGQRLSNDGDPYDWYSSYTVVLDDGPEGWQAMVPDDDGDMTPNLIPSVDQEGAQVQVNFQWSASGIVSRIQANLPDRQTGKPGSIVGRINSQKNRIKGRSPSWSISKPTEDDMAAARKYTVECRAARDDAQAKALEKQGGDAF